MGYITVIARVARDLWQCKQTLSSGFALGLGSFTAINPWHPCYNYYISHAEPLYSTVFPITATSIHMDVSMHCIAGNF